MKKLIKFQKQFTTAEQSEKLVDYGLPINSADCRIDLESSYVSVLRNTTFIEEYSDDVELAKMHLIDFPKCAPCWSLGRLIEILKTCVTNKEELDEIFDEIEYGPNELKSVVQIFYEYREVIDLTKLEEHE